MDDKESREERLQQLSLELSSMEEEDRDIFLQNCRIELRYADGYAGEFYQNYLEAAKYV